MRHVLSTIISKEYQNANYILKIDVNAVGESEAEELFDQMKPSVMSIVNKTQ